LKYVYAHGKKLEAFDRSWKRTDKNIGGGGVLYYRKRKNNRGKESFREANTKKKPWSGAPKEKTSFVSCSRGSTNGSVGKKGTGPSSRFYRTQ